MTQAQYIIGRKVNILELGEKLGNISEACRKLGISRQHFYDVKATLEEEGIEGLIQKSNQKPRFKNRVSEAIEKKILEYSLEFPTQGQVRVSNELLEHHATEVSPDRSPRRVGSGTLPPRLEAQAAREVVSRERWRPHRIAGSGPRAGQGRQRSSR